MLRRILLTCVLMVALASAPAQAEEADMLTSWYGPGLWGNPTASGAPLYYGQHAAAHKTLPIGTRMTVCYVGCTNVWVLDRGPYTGGRHLDLEQSAAEEIGLTPAGVDWVTAYW